MTWPARRAQFEHAPLIGRTLFTWNSGSSTFPGPAEPPAAATAARAGSMSPAWAATFACGVSPPTILKRFERHPADDLDAPADVVAQVGAGQAIVLAVLRSRPSCIAGGRFAAQDAPAQRDRFGLGLSPARAAERQRARSARRTSGPLLQAR